MSTKAEEQDPGDDVEADTPPPESEKARWAKLSLTISLVASYICLACFRSLVGPTTLTLAKTVNATEQSIPIIFTLRSFGYVIGFAIGGIFWDQIKVSFYRHSLIVTVNVLSGLASLTIPFCKSLVQLGVLFIAAGVFLGVLDIGLNVYFLQIWQGESPRYYQTLHFSYAIGYLIGPVMARIFLEDVESGKSEEIEMMDLPSMPRIIYAYVVLCMMFMVAGGVWLIICLMHMTVRKPSKSKPSLLKEPTYKFKVFAVVTTCLLIFLDGSIELGYQHVLSTFAFTKYGVTAIHSADMSTMFWGFFAIGSLGTIIIAGFFHPHILIIANNVIELIAGLIFLLLIERTNQYLALGNCILGLGASTLFSNTILWYDSYITITVRTMGLFLLCNVLAEMVIPELLTAVMRDDHLPVAIFIMSIPVLYLIIFVIQCVIFYPTGEKYPTDFGKPNKQASRKRICPIFLFTRLKTEKDVEDAESPAPENIEDMKPGPLDKKRSSKDKKKKEDKGKNKPAVAPAKKEEVGEKEEEEKEDEEDDKKEAKKKEDKKKGDDKKEAKKNEEDNNKEEDKKKEKEEKEEEDEKKEEEEEDKKEDKKDEKSDDAKEDKKGKKSSKRRNSN